MVELYQIFYKDEHKNKLYPFAKPYLNQGLTIFFENEVIRKLVPESQSEKIGVTSWKLHEKMRNRVGMRQPLTLEVLNSDFEVLSFTKNSLKHQMLSMANIWHPDFMKTIRLLWQKLDFKIPGEVKQPIYQNAHVSKSEIYKDYVENFLGPAMDLILVDEELNKLMLQPSGYGALNRGSDLRSVKAKLGLDDYPLCPFILERCYSLWLTMKKINVTYL